MSGNYVYLGKRDGVGDRFVGLSSSDARHHAYLIGQTGAGKSTLLRNLVVQHMRLGHGVGLIDPHGDLASDVLAQVPRSRANDLVSFDAGDFEYPIALNPLSGMNDEQRPLVVSGLTEAFKSLWRDSWGPRMEYIFGNALAALTHCQNVSLLGLNRMLVDDCYRRWVVSQVSDSFLRDFWENEFEGYDARFRREAIAPIQNKVGQLFLSPPMRNILGQVKSKVSLPFLMDRRRIFIANLARGRLGHDKANLLGSLLVSQFQTAAMGRATQPEEDRVDFHLHIDEFQSFSTDAFASMLAEARKFRLSLTLAHQYIAQLSPEVRDAVFGNVGTALAFRLGHTDAEVLAAQFGEEFVSSQFVDLRRYEVIARVLEAGDAIAPFRMRTLPPAEWPDSSLPSWRDQGRRRFCTPRKVVEKKLSDWQQD